MNRFFMALLLCLLTPSAFGIMIGKPSLAEEFCDDFAGKLQTPLRYQDPKMREIVFGDSYRGEETVLSQSAVNCELSNSPANQTLIHATQLLIAGGRSPALRDTFKYFDQVRESGNLNFDQLLTPYDFIVRDPANHDYVDSNLASATEFKVERTVDPRRLKLFINYKHHFRGKERNFWEEITGEICWPSDRPNRSDGRYCKVTSDTGYRIDGYWFVHRIEADLVSASGMYVAPERPTSLTWLIQNISSNYEIERFATYGVVNGKIQEITDRRPPTEHPEIKRSCAIPFDRAYKDGFPGLRIYSDAFVSTGAKDSPKITVIPPEEAKQDLIQMGFAFKFLNQECEPNHPIRGPGQKLLNLETAPWSYPLHSSFALLLPRRP